jgi:SAM-dependent methyltransferase
VTPAPLHPVLAGAAGFPAAAARACPNCGGGVMSEFYSIRGVPVHSVLLMPTREVAVNFPKGDIVLGFCDGCGFISNMAFDATVHSYSAEYEETQSFSPTFRKFHERLAASLVERFQLRQKHIIEIGCGKGDFLAMLCEMGENRGTGFDPAFVEERNPAGRDAVRFIKDFYSERYSSHQGDFVCCKMTLEHIPDTARFVETVRRSIGDRYDTPVFFQVPNATRVFRDLAFEDVYYEHCSYFTAGALARLFTRAGFDVLETGVEYDDQYLTILARPGRGVAKADPGPFDIADTARLTESFARHCRGLIAAWRERVERFRAHGKSVVVWGSGSKGVAFLSALGLPGAVEYVVDINPYRQGKFMAGSGQRIVSPEFLAEYKPDVVIVMNQIYRDEVQRDLTRLGLTAAELLTV